MTPLLQFTATRENWFPALVQHSPNLVLVVDDHCVITFANPAALQMLGVTHEDAIGSYSFGYVHPDDVERMSLRFVELLGSPGATMSESLRFVAANGEVRVLEVVTANYLDDPVISGIVVNGLDVTERDNHMRQLESSFDGITTALASAVELRDPYTAGHQKEVAQIASAIANDLDLPGDDVKGLEVAATIHDIGKIAIPSDILNKPGRLSVAEFEIIRSHAQTGADIVANVAFPWPVSEMIRQHHERMDGSGYPNSLKGDAILMGSRILAVADVVSAISNHRPYRPAPGLAAALAQLDANRGRLYDEDAVAACLHLYSDGVLPIPG